jgi:site-specific DNA-adenine methylase
MYPKIIEPFAGAANYALRYWESDVLLVDAYPVIVDIWKYLQTQSVENVLGLPRLNQGDRVDDLSWSCDAEKNFMGFVIAAHVEKPRRTATARTTSLRPNRQGNMINRAAYNLHKVRHWEIRLGSYLDIPNEEATWFIDPPYQYGGEHYVKNNKTINYAELADWCKSRKGQVIVCENTKADWLPFKPFSRLRGNVHNSTEAMWCNQPWEYQLPMMGV